MKKNFRFRNLLLEYYFVLSTSKARIDLNLDCGDVLESELWVNIEWFHFMRHQLFNDKEVFKTTFNKRILNKKCFLLDEKLRCPGCEDGKPFKIIKYRGIDIPVYDDDYGQQDFAIIGGEVISGGCYNFFAHEEFISYVDRYLEKEYLEGRYDMSKEVAALYPELEEKDK